MPFLELEHSRIRYEVKGEGYPILLFAPGFLSSRIERWRTNPSRPGVPQDFCDPIEAFAPGFRTIALDIRNAGSSRGSVGPSDDWESYTRDHLALIDHLGVSRCHVMGACIGVSFALAMSQARPGLVTAMVLQNPIGLSPRNRDAITKEFDAWAKEVGGYGGIDAAELPRFYQRLFGGEFLFAVTRQFVAACDIPMLLMPGDDVMHPVETSDDLARLAPRCEVVAPWKGAQHKENAIRRAAEFFAAHAPR